jgi:hypothetical protein
VEVARGHDYGQLLTALLPALDPPDGQEIGEWVMRAIPQEKISQPRRRTRFRPHVVCITMIYVDLGPENG